jgi:hypothetical protein
MYAVVVKLSLHDVEAVMEAVPKMVVGLVAASPGIVRGFFTRKDATGLGMFVYESEETARASAEQMAMASQHLPPMVSVDDIEVREVIGEV